MPNHTERHRLLRAALPMLLLLGAASCAGAVLSDPDYDDLNLCPNGIRPVTRIVIEPNPVRLRVGDTALVRVRVIGPDNQEDFLCSPAATVDIGNTAVAATVPIYRIRGVSLGETFFRARAGGKVDSVPIIVTNPADG